jgi:hypothetical protein
MRAFLLALVLLCAGAPAGAQTCAVSARFDATGNVQFDNRTRACAEWALQFSISGFTAASITFEVAPDSSGAPGSWSAATGIVLGSASAFPATLAAAGASQSYLVRASFPWVRVRVVSITGSGVIQTQLQGRPFLAQSVALAGSSTGGFRSSPVCDQWAGFTLAMATRTRVVTGVAGKQIYVCRLLAGVDPTAFNSQEITATYGTGANCATGTTVLWTIAQGQVAWFAGSGVGLLFSVPAGQDLCLTNTFDNGGGLVTYAQF